MIPGKVYVWSSGLEQWEPTSYKYTTQYISVDIVNQLQIVFLSSKIMQGGRLLVYTDPLNRFIGIYVSDD